MLFSLICVMLETFIHLIWHGVFLHAVVECFPSSSLTRSLCFSQSSSSRRHHCSSPKSPNLRMPYMAAAPSCAVRSATRWTCCSRGLRTGDACRTRTAAFRRAATWSSWQWIDMPTQATSSVWRPAVPQERRWPPPTPPSILNVRMKSSEGMCVWQEASGNEVTFHLISLSLLSASQTESVRLSLSVHRVCVSLSCVSDCVSPSAM